MPENFRGGGAAPIIWSVSSEDELRDTRKYLGEEIVKEYIIAEDLPRKICFSKSLEKAGRRNEDQTLMVVFLSRISPKKNLDYCADILNHRYSKPIQFDIYGTLEDKEYWKKCQEKFKNVPSTVSVRYCGELHPDNVIQKLSDYDVFLFPTKGENYGHVIYESLASGCISVISDTTPWKGFEEAGCGKIVTIDNLIGFQSAIEEICSRNTTELIEMKKNAVNYAEKTYTESVSSSGYKTLI